MSEKRPQNIREVIRKIETPGFKFRNFKPEEFAPAPDKTDKKYKNGGAAFVVASNEEGKRRIKLTQLRKLFADIKRLEERLKGEKDEEKNLEDVSEDFYAQVLILHPELAYARGRKLIDDDFFKLMRVSLSREKLETVEDYQRFSQFVTAILAYSKYLSE